MIDDFLHGGAGSADFFGTNLATLPGVRGGTRKSHAGGGRVPVSSTHVISGVDGVEKTGPRAQGGRTNPMERRTWWSIYGNARGDGRMDGCGSENN